MSEKQHLKRFAPARDFGGEPLAGYDPLKAIEKLSKLLAKELQVNADLTQQLAEVRQELERLLEAKYDS